MPRVHTAKAAKDYPAYGIVKGETYYHWSFYRGPKQMSKERPRSSQLTQREELIAMYEAQEQIEDMAAWEPANREDLAGAVRHAAERLGEAADAADEKYGNMPENFQNAEQGQFLESFSSECQDCQSTLENIADELDDTDNPFDDIEDPNDLSWPNES